MSGERGMPPWFRAEVAKAIKAKAGELYTPPLLVEAEAPDVAA